MITTRPCQAPDGTERYGLDVLLDGVKIGYMMRIGRRRGWVGYSIHMERTCPTGTLTRCCGSAGRRWHSRKRHAIAFLLETHEAHKLLGPLGDPDRMEGFTNYDMKWGDE